MKRKFKTSTGNNSKQIVRWWFVVRGEEKVLEQLQSEWGSVSIQTAWKLEPVFEFQSPPPPLQATPSPSNSNIMAQDADNTHSDNGLPLVHTLNNDLQTSLCPSSHPVAPASASNNHPIALASASSNPSTSSFLEDQ